MLNEVGHSKFQEELTKAIVEIKQKAEESKPMYGQHVYRFLTVYYWQ